MTHIYHEEDGLVFHKVEADTGISYLSVPITEVTDPQGLLVRHGNPVTGHCGYYPVSLVFANPEQRAAAAARRAKRPPNERWIDRTRALLETHGLQTVH